MSKPSRRFLDHHQISKRYVEVLREDHTASPHLTNLTRDTVYCHQRSGPPSPGLTIPTELHTNTLHTAIHACLYNQLTYPLPETEECSHRTCPRWPARLLRHNLNPKLLRRLLNFNFHIKKMMPLKIVKNTTNHSTLTKTFLNAESAVCDGPSFELQFEASQEFAAARAL